MIHETMINVTPKRRLNLDELNSVECACVTVAVDWFSKTT